MVNELDEGIVEIKDHLDKDHDDICGYCGQYFAPEEIVIEKTLHGRKWKFCSEECMRDFKDASDFKDQDLDAEQEYEANIKFDEE